MFSTITPLAPHTGRNRPATDPNARPQHRFSVPQTVEEAYEMRLLAEVARWDDQAAFEEIYARHRAAVMHVALRVCHDADTAEEIAQQTFIALWARAKRLVDKSIRLRPWLATVARNAAIDHMRAERPSVSIDAAADIPSSVPTPDDLAIAGESKARLAKALAKLSEDQRAAIELVYIADKTYQSAADVLGEPVGTIKSRVRLAIGHLRTHLENAES